MSTSTRTPQHNEKPRVGLKLRNAVMDSNDLKTKAPHYLSSLKVKWMQLQETPTIFAYTLNVQIQKFIVGTHHFYVELNPERTQLRRKPQTINSLRPNFDTKKFHFNKVNPLEVMLTIPFEDAETQMIINRSPLTKFHTLICPQVENNLVQRITSYGLRFVVTFLRYANDVDCRVGYNSPGALASVNHLHFHLVHLPKSFYIDRVALKLLCDKHDYIYRLDNKMPTEAICFVIQKDEADDAVNEKLEKIFKLTEWLCAQDVPHNLFITHNRQNGVHENTLKIFLFVRATYCDHKDVTNFNVGFCEQAGYITVGEQKQLDELTELAVIERIRSECAGAYEKIYNYLINMT